VDAWPQHPRWERNAALQSRQRKITEKRGKMSHAHADRARHAFTSQPTLTVRLSNTRAFPKPASYSTQTTRPWQLFVNRSDRLVGVGLTNAVLGERSICAGARLLGSRACPGRMGRRRKRRTPSWVIPCAQQIDLTPFVLPAMTVSDKMLAKFHVCRYPHPSVKHLELRRGSRQAIGGSGKMREWPATTEFLRIFRFSPRCTVLGPGVRAVIWVQGCPFRCKGCVVPESLPFDGGELLDVESLSHELSELEEIQGVTFSGGEPMSQAGALVALIDATRNKRDLSFAAYTGFDYETLRDKGTPAQQQLLTRLDLLIDGPYISTRHTDLIWRGSDNQRVLFLSNRYREMANRMHDRGTRIELEITASGVGWMGIPPRGFPQAFRSALADRGITLDAILDENRNVVRTGVET